MFYSITCMGMVEGGTCAKHIYSLGTLLQKCSVSTFLLYSLLVFAVNMNSKISLADGDCLPLFVV